MDYDRLDAAASLMYEDWRGDMTESFHIVFVAWDNLSDDTKNYWRNLFLRACYVAGLEV